MGFIAILLALFGLGITWLDGNIGEGMNFIIAGLVFAFVDPNSLNFLRRR